MGMLIRLVAILLIVSNSLSAISINKKLYEKKSTEYYKEYKAEWDKLPLANKKRIAEAVRTGEKYGMGYTLGATRFLENRGQKSTFDNKTSINTNNHGSWTSYDCGDFGINTMTYLQTIGKETKSRSTHVQACKTLANNKELNLKMAMMVYKYALNRYDDNMLVAWNYYNTGRASLVNDRIYKVKGAIMLLKKELDS